MTSLPSNSKKRSRAISIKLNAKVADVSIRPDLFMINVDRTYDLIKRPIGDIGSLGKWSIMHFRPELTKSLLLSHSPTGEPRRLGVRASDIHVDSCDFERVRRVERENSTVAAFELRVNGTANSGGGEKEECESNDQGLGHSGCLLATTAWKSKRLVSTGRPL